MWRILRDAATLGDLDGARRQVDEGVDVNIPDHLGLTPLDLAVDYRKYAVADLLRRSGAIVAEGLPMAA